MASLSFSPDYAEILYCTDEIMRRAAPPALHSGRRLLSDALFSLEEKGSIGFGEFHQFLMNFFHQGTGTIKFSSACHKFLRTICALLDDWIRDRFSTVTALPVPDSCSRRPRVACASTKAYFSEV